ncbi:glycosyltransferase family 25 protein [Pseudogemmobacter humi]|uniref:Glycosyltransferase family 25 (LPS biosynthesis protein) n=1 Tax=Pseudogemmobacter humi TaxID=2483812 RepID=A0A3P5XMV8_9RHOB|nr:glycosyltransferase family 25 protein [Pseudogemmobacter humi]VDC31660.1 Glycosyltransferase family 25 (LPS biosynthesis protein) [Pseudogemmobacter humi]
MSAVRGDLGVWWINLDRAEERRRQMEERLARLDLDAERFSAIDGRAAPDLVAQSLDAAAFRRNMGRAALPAEVGCYLSHLAVWKKFLADGRPFALVLEDDVVFHDDFLAALGAALDHSDRWDMLKLNRIRAKLPVRQGRAGEWDLNAYLGPATGFGAYLITRDLALRLVPRMLPMTMPVDYEATRWWAHDFRLLGLEPFPSHVDDGGVSTITGRNFAGVVKPPRHRRLGNYAMRAGNYPRRLWGMIRRGMFPAPKQRR